MSLSSATGPTGGANTLTLTLPSTATTKFVNSLVGVQFQATTSAAAATASCATNPATSSQVTASGTLRYISTRRSRSSCPTSRAAGDQGYVLVCAYNQAQSGSVIPTTATVVAKANYLVSGTPTLRLTASGGAILPANGPDGRLAGRDHQRGGPG